MSALRSFFNTAVGMSKSLCVSSVARKTFGQGFNFVRNYSPAYEGDGKTHAVLLNDDKSAIMITSYSTIGFSLNNGVTILGPMAIFPNCVLSWNVGDVQDINEAALSLFFKLEPKLDVLILGIPDYNKRDRKLISSLALLIRRYKIQVEILSPELACPTFNFLHAEKRFVAAAIIPPYDVSGEESTGMEAPHKIGYSKK